MIFGLTLPRQVINIQVMLSVSQAIPLTLDYQKNLTFTPENLLFSPTFAVLSQNQGVWWPVVTENKF